MNVINNIRQIRSWHTINRGTRCVLVPTMGALHEGHAALIRAARELAGPNGNVAVSIFVNPLQFGPNEDFTKYPRTLVEDLAVCRDNGADMIFAPKAEDLYPADRSIQLFETSLSKTLCGASRPGHFDGVCTVVAKLFNLVQCDDAVFGKKDYQQLAIIRQLVRDLDFNIVLHGIDTVREPDGLAMSSRNRYLTPEERAQAPAIRAALVAARDAWKNGGERDPAALLQLIKQHLQQHAPLGRIDYVDAVDANTLQPVSSSTELVVIAAAVFFGGARLIDNIELK
ncbi:MAG: pantoate--beta-alanine ligase [Prosthecobacter sp.]|jgi:pantoate--beta-alanine ligase|uniref:pantoate--beta-alanine ligase n=1 Tax=Prosthecobacter sp. TaxID=1965333 RepID=UPI0019FBDF94|nr:pantoate--beta-alanine ligase [Prosthecobacter sp.]MBE2286940.1 pantoate--beta-alanine ligase [Prosthecobacter sp.]